MKLMQIFKGVSHADDRWNAQSGHTFVFNSKRPFGVSIMIAGGRKGYSEGSKMRKWYRPPSNSVPGGPRMVQCHSYKA